MDMMDCFNNISRFLANLTPDERRAILDYQFPQMFDPLDSHWYRDYPPMTIRGVPMDHAEAVYLYLAVLQMWDAGFDCGEPTE